MKNNNWYQALLGCTTTCLMNRVLFLVIFFTACNAKLEQSPAPAQRFELPVVVQPAYSDTIKAIQTKYIYWHLPELMGQYKFGDTIYFNGEKLRRDISETDYRWEHRNEVDSGLSSDGLQIIPDYNCSIAFSNYSEAKLYYPVYIVNETIEPKVFLGKDGHGFAVQEAVDSNEYFRFYPIESNIFDFCGYGKFRRKIRPGEFLMFLFPKYAGETNTLLRIRFKIGENILISRSFPGNVNPEQFLLDMNENDYKQMKETKGAYRNWLFYGAISKQEANFEFE